MSLASGRFSQRTSVMSKFTLRVGYGRLCQLALGTFSNLPSIL